MATWKDGAAYAPTERPDGFAAPVVEPLTRAEATPAVTPGPVPPPDRLDATEAPPLEHFGPRAQSSRRPEEPFDVAAATLTSMPLLADGRRDPRAPFSVSSSALEPPEPTMPPPPPPGAKPLPGPPPDLLPVASRRGALPSAATPPTDAQKTLVYLIAGLCVVGVVLTDAAPMLMIIAGLISVLRVPWTARIGAAAVGIGSTFLLVQLMIPTASAGVLFGLTSLVLAAAFVIRTFANKPPSDDDDDDNYWSPLDPPGLRDAPPLPGQAPRDDRPRRGY